MRMLRLISALCCASVLFAQAPSNQDKPKLDLHGDRFPGLKYEDLTPAQKVIADRAIASRGTIGIFNITLRSPELSEATRGIISSRIPPVISARQNELAVLLTGRYWNAQYEFSVHHRVAARAGTSEETIAAIVQGRRPAALLPEEVPVYDFVTELLNNRQVSDATFQTTKEKMGEKGVVDLIGLVSFYQMASLMMNVDRYPLDEGRKPELPALARALPSTTPDMGGERFKPLTTDEMTPAQKNLMDLLVSGKIEGGTRGPVNILLRSPDIGEGILRFGAYERFHSPLPMKLNELAALVTIRNAGAQFPWYAHHRAGVQAGLSEAVVSAIAQGRKPAGLQADEQAVYNFTAEVLRTGQVSDATFAAAKQQSGERGVVEVMGVIGYYQTVSLLTNVDRYPLPDAVAAEIKPLANPIP
jgi:4-carboxymuconolactone decarboxylase